MQSKWPKKGQTLERNSLLDMAQKHTSNVDDQADPATVPSKSSAKNGPPETERKQVGLYLVEEMEKLSDLDLVKIQLACAVSLHKRMVDFDQ